MHEQSARAAVATLFILSAGCLVLFIAFEIVIAMPVSFIVYAVVAGALIVSMTVLASRRWTISKMIVLALLIAAFAATYFMPWTSRKPFLRDFRQIRTGMTATEVERIMGRYMKGVGTKWQIPGQIPGATSTLTEVGTGKSLNTIVDTADQWKFEGSITYRHSNTGRFDSDWGIVRFDNGRVVSIVFMPD